MQGGNCNATDPASGLSIETKGSELRVISCTASYNGQDLPCTYGIENVGGNSGFYEWVCLVFNILQFHHEEFSMCIPITTDWNRARPICALSLESCHQCALKAAQPAYFWSFV